MQAKEIITKKRLGEENSKDELEFLLKGFLSGEIKEYQLSAWLMAVFFQGMTSRELSYWTELMWHSGITLERSEEASRIGNQYWIDKHSTGGVGDKTSLVLVPLVKTVSEKYLKNISMRIPMISGRGLGHTGGTLDKLESVSGFKTQLEIQKAMELINSQGFFMAGQTDAIAPADRLLYSLRDVTGTIESIPLIVSSIMSKKLAENLNGILFDIKTGIGAFMTSSEQARELAQGLISVAKSQGLDAVGLITKMDEPLGWKTGHFLEVEECADFLNGQPREKHLEELILESAAWMLTMASKRKISVVEAKSMCLDIIEKREAYPLFRMMFESQGGDFNVFENERELFRKHSFCFEYKAEQSGVISLIHARQMGVLLVEIGGGRLTKESTIDNKAGFEFYKKVGHSVHTGDTILRAYYRKAEDLEKLKKLLPLAIKISEEKMSQSDSASIVEEIIL